MTRPPWRVERGRTVFGMALVWPGSVASGGASERVGTGPELALGPLSAGLVLAWEVRL